MKTFSDRFLASLKPRKSRYDEHEGRGFYLRIEPTGKKAFYYIYRTGGKLKPIKIGDYPAMKLKDARKRHQDMMEMRERGLDPSIEVQAEIKGTFGALAAEYLKRHAVKNKESHRAGNERILNVDVLPYWQNRPANQIRRADVITLLNRVLDRGAHRQANKTLACIRKVFNFGLSSAWPGLEYNPCARMEPPGKERRVERVLTDIEIRTFWSHFNQTQVKKQSIDCLKFILATGVRPGEALFIYPAEIDGDWLTIPKERMKNNKPHRVYLNKIAKALIDKKLPIPFPFPTEVSGLSQIITRQRKSDSNKLEIQKFTPKDLRRTAATYLGKLGYKNASIGIFLSHTDPSVTSVYNLHEYDELKQEMSEAWGKELERILAVTDEKEIGQA
jgi:integrase